MGGGKGGRDLNSVDPTMDVVVDAGLSGGVVIGVNHHAQMQNAVGIAVKKNVRI